MTHLLGLLEEKRAVRQQVTQYRRTLGYVMPTNVSKQCKLMHAMIHRTSQKNEFLTNAMTGRPDLVLHRQHALPGCHEPVRQQVRQHDGRGGGWTHYWCMCVGAVGTGRDVEKAQSRTCTHGPSAKSDGVGVLAVDVVSLVFLGGAWSFLNSDRRLPCDCSFAR